MLCAYLAEVATREVVRVTRTPAICLRFGAVMDRENPGITLDHHYLDIVLTYEDLTLLVAGAIDAPDSLEYGVFHGVSNNRWKRLDITNARELLGYNPQDDAFATARARLEAAKS